MKGVSVDSQQASPLVIAALIVATVLPVLLVSVPPLVDYPNHLARTYVLFKDGADGLNAFYQVHYRPLPNLAADIVTPLLMHFLSPLWAGKIFVVLTLLLNIAGVMLLSRAL